MEYGGARADAKSIMDLMVMAVPGGAEVAVEATGPDAESVAGRILAVLAEVPPT